MVEQKEPCVLCSEFPTHRNYEIVNDNHDLKPQNLGISKMIATGNFTDVGLPGS